VAQAFGLRARATVSFHKSQTASHWEARIMTRSLLSLLPGGSGRKSAPRPAARRRPFVPRVLLLEDRTLLAVQFTPAPYAEPANRPDTPLGPLTFEPYLSVNAADPGDVAVSARDNMRISTTAGGSFTGTSFEFRGGTDGDTGTVYDSAGRLFWVNVTPSGGLNGQSIAIDQIDPTTGGLISQHVVDQVPDSSFEDDKEFIAADPTNNNLYVIWTRIHAHSDLDTQVLMRYSSDQGASWSAPVRVDNGSDEFVWPATVTVAPDHVVYAAYHSVSETVSDSMPDHDGKIVVVRFNNDLSDRVRSIAEVPGRADITFNIQTEGFARRIPGATFLTLGSIQPWILADPVRPGNIYVVSADSNNGFHQDYGDIRIARSTDYGLTWSSSLIETSSTLFPNAAIDQFGNIVVAWYDNRRGLNNAAGHFMLDVYATYSTDGGLTFAPAFPVNDQTPGVNTPNGNIFDPDPGAPHYGEGPPPTTRIGEYFGLALWGGTAYVAWNGNTFAGFDHPTGQQIWTKSFDIRGSLAITGTPSDDFITIRSMPSNRAFVEVLVNGQRQCAGLWSALTGITVNPTPGNDLVEIDDTVPGTPVTVNNGNGNDPVWITPTSHDLGAIRGPVIVHGGSGAGNLVFYDDSNAANTTYITTGTSVTWTNSPIISYSDLGVVFIGGSGKDTYETVGTFPSQVRISPHSGSDTVSIDDRNNAADTSYTITNASIARTGAGTVFLTGAIANLLITGSSGNNMYNVVSTQSLSSTTVNTGSGRDTVNVQSTAGPLFINSGSGGDTITLSNSAATLGGIGHVIANDPSKRAAVTVDDSGFAGSTTYTLTSTQVAVAAWPNFHLVYSNLASLNLKGSTGDDRFNIESTASSTVTTITAGSGSNRFDLTPMANYLAAVAGPLNLVGSGADALVFWDQANPNSEIYTFDDIPSMLTLATLPTFATSWTGMDAVYLETNHMSTVNDPSGKVLVDVPPPSAPDNAHGPATAASIAAADGLVEALLGAIQEGNAAVAGSLFISDALDWLTTRARKDADPPAWAALEL
jgi:hypothetical protein